MSNLGFALQRDIYFMLRSLSLGHIKKEVAMAFEVSVKKMHNNYQQW
jgi:hypothetical protein